MPTKTAPTAAALGKTRPSVSFRMRITAGPDIAIGPGKVRLLEAIDETGSLTAAAKSIEMSYRRAWLLLDELNKSLKEPAVVSVKGGERGGGSALTDVGRLVVQRYRHIEQTAAKACSADIQSLTNLLAV